MEVKNKLIRAVTDRTIRSLSVSVITGFALFGSSLAFAATEQISMPFQYRFSDPGTLIEARSSAESTSPYWWLVSGDRLVIQDGVGSTAFGRTQDSDVQKKYATLFPVPTDNGTHPQNLFVMLLKGTYRNPSAQVYFKRVTDNLSNSANRDAYVGQSLFARYIDDKNLYYGGIRADGQVVIKKKTNGVYQTLAMKKILPGTYSPSGDFDLIPLNQWIGLKLDVKDTENGPQLSLSTDIGRTGSWAPALSVVDDARKFGSPISSAGKVGIRSDYADAQFDSFTLSDAAASGTTGQTPAPSTPTPGQGAGGTQNSYDSTVLADSPVMYLAMSGTGSETDKTGKGHNGTYKGGAPAAATLPNGDRAAAFNGSTQYLTVPSSAALSIPTTKKLTWEAWVRPDTLSFSKASGDGYVDWMGKCANYSPTCEWEARMYGQNTAEGRPSRLSAYVFNPSAGLGSGADWQPASSIITAGKWLHVVAEYDMTTTPSGCSSGTPGSISIWVNGVKWNMSKHMPTGCMSQFSVSPKASNSPLNIGTMAFDTWFKGAVGKVAVYDRLLSQTEINEHYTTMTGKTPSGSCADTCTAAMP